MDAVNADKAVDLDMVLACSLTLMKINRCNCGSSSTKSMEAESGKLPPRKANNETRQARTEV